MRKTSLFFLKGLFMGIADVIPGVSGGTIAFITGIYPRLIHAISSITPLIPALLKGRVKESFSTIRKIDFPFLIPLGFGIITAILLFSKLMVYLMENFSSLTFAFFGGLIISSAIVMYKQKGKFKLEKIVFAVLGFIIAYSLAGFSELSLQLSLPLIFLVGAVAITAMILPGISGSFILLLLGQYNYILNALHNYNFPVIITFAAGALAGLLSFSKFLDYILQNYRTLTISFLIGLMVGSLRIPFDIIKEGPINSYVFVAGVLGFSLVYFLEKFNKN